MRKIVLLCVISLISVAVLMLTTLQGPGSPEQGTVEKHIVLLTDTQTGSFYMQVRQGAQEAAEYLGARLQTAMIDWDNLSSQAAALAQNSVTAAILYLDETQIPDALSAVLKENHLRFAALNLEAGDLHIVRDVQADAKTIADAAKDLKCSRLLLSGDDDILASAVQEAWDGDIRVLRGTAGVTADPGDCLVAMTSASAKALLALKQGGQLAADTPLLCVDTGETRAEDLESGLVSGMLLIKPYTIGYLALQHALALDSTRSGILTIPVPSALVTRQTMYQPQNAYTVFPLLQQ